ncbi:MAG: energy transducer TonB [Cellvibrionaceae bacterium]
MKLLTILIIAFSITGCATSPESCKGKFIEYKVRDASEPLYPRSAYDQKIEGWAQVAFTVTAQGDAKDIRVTDGYPKGVFDKQAMAVVEKAKFNPAMQDCKKIEVTNGSVKFNFTLDK